jgi:hypothetical protein
MDERPRRVRVVEALVPFRGALSLKHWLVECLEDVQSFVTSARVERPERH